MDQLGVENDVQRLSDRRIDLHNLVLVSVGFLNTDKKSQRIIGELQRVPHHWRPRWCVGCLTHTLHYADAIITVWLAERLIPPQT
jgi:hypothetical protein